MNLSNLSKYKLARIGLNPEPCATPEYVALYFQFSIYPDFRNFQINSIKASSLIRSLNISTSIWWSILSK